MRELSSIAGRFCCLRVFSFARPHRCRKVREGFVSMTCEVAGASLGVPEASETFEEDKICALAMEAVSPRARPRIHIPPWAGGLLKSGKQFSQGGNNDTDVRECQDDV